MKRDSEICCTGNCSQADECPRYRQPAPQSSPSANAWILDTLAVCALALIVWGVATYGDAVRAWLAS